MDRPRIWRTGVAAAFLAMALTAACSDDRSGPASPAEVAGSISWLEEGPVAITADGTTTRPGVVGDRSDIAWSGVMELRTQRLRLVADDDRESVRYEDGDRVVVSTFLPDVQKPWTAFDGEALAAVALAGRLDDLNRGSNFPFDDFLAVSREPSPLTAIEVLSGEDFEVVKAAHDDVEGSRWTRLDLVVPAEALADAFGTPAATNLVVDCREGARWSVWVDDDGRLRRIAYRADHASVSSDVVFSLDPDPSAEPVELPPATDVLDVAGRARELAADPAGASVQGARPCTGRAQEPTRLDRDVCAPAETPDGSGIDLDLGWRALDVRGSRTPSGAGRLWVSLTEPLPFETALDLPEGIEVVGVVAVFPDGQSLVVKMTLPVEPGTTSNEVRDLVLERAARGPGRASVAAEEVAVAAVHLSATWAALVSEGSDCRYWAAAPDAMSPAMLAPSVDSMR